MNFLIVIKNKLSKRKYSILEEIKEIKKSYQLTSNSKTKNLSVNYLLFKSILNSFLHSYSNHRAFNLDKSLLKILLSSLWFPFRVLLIKFIRFVDFLAPTPYGSSEIPPIRILEYGKLKLFSKSKSAGIDIRSYMWKKEALNIILDSISKVVNTKNKINFIEIGAASGIVSLFLAKWASKQNIDYEITAIEPSLPNVDYLMETAYLNNLKVNIIPMAISNKKEWLPFSQESSKGLVADGLRDNSPTNYVPTISIKDFSIYVKEVDICYVDAFLNENKILQELLLTFEEIKSFIIEFDYGIPNETLKLLNEKSYFLEKQVNTNYIFTRKT